MLEKIKPEQMEQYGVVSAPDHLSGNPADVKAIFDRLVKELVAVVVNDIIDAHNGLDKDMNQRIDEVIEELKNVSEINAENLGAQNIALDKKGETTLADQYNTGELAPTVWGALSRTLEMFLRKGGDTMAGDFAIEKPFPKFRLDNTTVGRSAVVNMGNDSTAVFGNEKDANNRQIVYINTETAPLENAFRLYRVVNGVSSNYGFLHTGNLDALNMARVVSGSYTGTGADTKTLTFPFVPKFVYVATKGQGSAHGHLLAINGMTSAWNSVKDANDSLNSNITELSWGEKSLTLSQYGDTPGNPQYVGYGPMNHANTEYVYIAIG